MQAFKISVINIIMFLWMSSSVLAQELTVHLNDQFGKPLAGAVVEIADNSANNSAISNIAIMDQINKRFVPELLVIKQGQSVSFPNSDDIRHHVYSFSEAKPFELKLYAGKPENPITFNQHGVVILGCNIHDSMVGSIYVAKGDALITSDEGTVKFISETDIQQLSVWHPLQSTNPEHQLLVNIDATHQDTKNIVTINLAVEPPAPRDTFSDTFSGQSTE